MTDIMPFEFEKFNIRVIVKDGEPWFVVNDVCSALEMVNPWDVVQRLDSDDLGKTEVTDSLNRIQSMNIVNEAGLYEIIFRSTKEEAKRFRRWVTHEVLPEIRKTGQYAIQSMSELERARLYVQALELAEERGKELEVARPKAEEYDAYIDSEGNHTLAMAAQTLYPMTSSGRTNFVKTLRQLSIICKPAFNERPRAYQSYIDSGWFVVKKNAPWYKPQTLITPYGLSCIYKLLADNGEEVIDPNGEL